MKGAIKELLLTKSHLVRAGAQALAGLGVTYGVISESDTELVIGAVVAVVSGVISIVVEKIKDDGTASVQEVLETTRDSWAGPETLRKAKELKSKADTPLSELSKE